MQVQIEIPEDMAKRFGRNSEELSRAALEAMVLEGIRSLRLTQSEARRLLGIQSRYEMDGFLKEHGLLLSTTVEDVDRDTDIAASFLK